MPGFLLDIDDPFAEGTARTWARIKSISVPRLPIVLPYSDPKTAEAIKNYIVRANGGSDDKRVKAARKALEKVVE